MIEVKDEVLDTSSQLDNAPRYLIRDNNGNIIYDDVQLEMKTPVLQQPTPINRALFKSINEFKLGDIILSTVSKDSKWLKLDGSTYNKTDYKLGDLMYGGFTNTITKIKAGDYYYKVVNKSVTRYTSLNDMLDDANGYTQTFSTVVKDIVYYSNNEYLLTSDNSIYTFSDTTWTLVTELTGTGNRMVATNYGIYVWYTNSKQYIYYSSDGVSFSKVNSGTLLSGLNLKVTSDGEYAYYVASSGVRTYQGSTENVINASLTDCVDVVYDEANGVFYGLCSSDTGSYVAIDTKDIEGQTVNETITILDDTQISKTSSGSIAWVGDAIITNIGESYTAVIQNNSIIQKTALLNLDKDNIKTAFNIDENVIMLGKIKIDKTQFTLFNKVSDDGFGDYYILGDD